MEFQEFSGARNSGPKFRLTGASIAVLAVIVGALAIGIFAAMPKSEPAEAASSQGEAEVACERDIEMQVGTAADLSYTHVAETGAGDFTLYGTVAGDYGTAKFTCSVIGANGDGTATANAEIYE